ncbi:DoxX family protein [Pseudomonas sp. HK3]|jgi:putative oxidoreductase
MNINNEPISNIASLYNVIANTINKVQPLALLAARLYVAWVFFASGLTKLRDWESTLFLFEEEYSVPFIHFEVAAWLGTAGELILPVLLVFGLLGRFSALGLFIVNIVAVISLEEIAPAAYTLHVLWGLLLAQVFIWGPGMISIDRLVKNRLLK